MPNLVRTFVRRLFAAAGVMLRGQHYDNATTTVENRRHWANAKDQPPVVTNDPVTRAKLRSRARYEVANNCYASGMCLRLATETIGYVAPTPQINTGDNGLNTFLEDEWRAWSESPVVNLPEKLNMMDFARRTDGESFPLFITDADVTESQTGYTLNLVIVPQSRVTSYSFKNRGLSQTETRQVERDGYTQQIRVLDDDGVIVNLLTGFPHEYKVANVVDETLGNLIGSNPITVSERYMKQWFHPLYPGQYRGVCEIGAALGLFAQLRRYGLASLSAAEVAAMLTVLLKTTLPADDSGQPTPLQPFSTRDFERNMITAMPDGWDLTQLKPEQPISSYEMFVNMVLREIGRVLDIPFGIVAGDFSKYNYSSARLEVTGYDETKKYDRKQLCVKILNPLHYEWLNEVVRRRPDVEKVVKENKYKLTWQFTNRPSIDPLKDATVDDMRLNNGTISYSEVYAIRGMDYREQFQQISKENKEKAEFNLTFGGQSDTINSIPSDDGSTNGVTRTPNPLSKKPNVSVAETALNGAQITSLLLVIDKLAAKQYPAGAVKQIIKSAFPGITDADVDKIINEFISYTAPVPTAPVAV